MKSSNGKILSFFRNNAVYIVLAACVFAIGLSVLIIALKEKDTASLLPDSAPVSEVPQDDTTVPDPVVNPEPAVEEPVLEEVIFSAPVLNPTAIENYSDTMVFSGTLKRYSTHLATDYFADEGTQVFAAYKGRVESVENDILRGVTVTIDHGDGLKTVYNSISDDVEVSVGDTVEKGDLIGYISTTNRQEYKSGAHLHFEVLKDGSSISPAEYFMGGDK